MTSPLRISLLGMTALTALLAASLPAMPARAMQAESHRGAFGSADKHSFDHSKQVGDEELAKMRGGMLNINGILIDFSFLSRVQVGLEQLQNLNIKTEDMIQAANAAQQISDLLQPNIIQNMDDNTLISIQQALNVDIINPDVLNQQAQAAQLQFQQVIQ